MIEREADSDSPPPIDLRVSAHEFEMWCRATPPILGVDAREIQHQREFTMQAAGSHFAGMAVVRAQSAAARFERSRGAIARSGVDTIIFQLSLKGGFHFNADGLSSEVYPGDITVFDLTRLTSVTAQPYENISVILRRSLLTALIPDLDGMHGLVLRAGTPLNELLKSHMLMLHAQARRTTTAEHVSTARGTAALLAACVGPSATGGDAASRSVAFSLLHAMRNAIDRDLGNPELNADSIGAQFGVSRASLYRAFEPMGGVRNYIRLRRLMRSYLAISDPDRADERISAIAQQCGFNNDAVFSRAFRDLYGMTPSEVRAAAKGGQHGGARNDGQGEKSFWSLNRWLLGLEANRIIASSEPLAPTGSPPERLRARARRAKPGTLQKQG